MSLSKIQYPSINDNIELCKEYLKKCYSPYSKFNVVSMLVCKDKNYFGVNVENCSYSLTVCAETNCLSIDSNNFMFEQIRSILIAAPSGFTKVNASITSSPCCKLLPVVDVSDIMNSLLLQIF